MPTVALTKSPTPDLRYYFQHYARTRPFFRDLPRTLDRKVGIGGVPEGNDALFSAITSAAVTQGVRPQALLRNGWLAAEAMVAQTLAQHALSGRLTYELTSELTEAFRHSHTGEMRLSDVPQTAGASYIHFGPQIDILLNGHYPVEGALVVQSPLDWRFAVFARNLDASQGSRRSGWLLPDALEYLVLRIPKSSLDLPFDAAVQQAIDADIADIDRAEERMALSVTRGATADAFEHARQALVQNREVLTQVLSLVGNTLAYHATYADDVSHQWQPGAPDSMVAKSVRPGKEGKNTVDKLKSMGWVQVTLLGRAFQLEEDEAGEGIARPHGSPSPHMRTAHWRNQAYGPQFSLRKLIWIRQRRIGGRSAAE